MRCYRQYIYLYLYFCKKSWFHLLQMKSANVFPLSFLLNNVFHEHFTEILLRFNWLVSIGPGKGVTPKGDTSPRETIPDHWLIYASPGFSLLSYDRIMYVCFRELIWLRQDHSKVTQLPHSANKWTQCNWENYVICAILVLYIYVCVYIHIV